MLITQVRKSIIDATAWHVLYIWSLSLAWVYAFTCLPRAKLAELIIIGSSCGKTQVNFVSVGTSCLIYARHCTALSNLLLDGLTESSVATAANSLPPISLARQQVFAVGASLLVHNPRVRHGRLLFRFGHGIWIACPCPFHRLRGVVVLVP